MSNLPFDSIYAAPVLMLGVFGIVVLILGVAADRRPKGRLNHFLPPEYFSIALMTAAVVVTAIALWKYSTMIPIQSVDYVRNMVHIDAFGIFFGLIATIGTLIVMVLSLEYFGDHNTKHRAEYFSLLIFATAAIMIVAVAADLLMIYLSLEFLSLASYVLASYWKNDEKSSEAGIKYFLFGAISSAVMLYGMSMLYGIAGSTSLKAVAASMIDPINSSTAALAAVVMVLVGLGFKLALVPFHLWAPDTYEGAPTPITAWLSVASKAGGLAVVARFLLVGVPLQWAEGAVALQSIDWYSIVLVLSAVSMTLGNLVAITQHNIKRMLAYSSIAQVGYMMIGILAAVAGTQRLALSTTFDSFTTTNYGFAGLLIYAASYLFMNLGAFAVAIAIERKSGSSEISSFTDLGRRAPFLAASLVVFFLSLAGIPPTAGFIGKLYVFGGAIQTGRTDLLILALIAIANSVISVYYYFNVVRVMYMKELDSPEPLRASGSLKTVVALMLIVVLAIGVFAGPLIHLSRGATF